MKRLLYTLSAIIFLSSCQSINRAVERGDYELAIAIAKRKIEGDKKKSTKNIKLLEVAYHKALRRDLDRVKFLTDENRPENYDRIFEIYSDIKHRQDALLPLLPLVGKDGYAATFKFIKVEGLLKETSKQAAAYHYKNAGDFLAKAKKGDKWAARNAYDELGLVHRHYRHYNDIEELKEQALFLGTNRVLLRTENRSLVAMPIGFEEALLSMDIKGLNDRWTEFYTIKPGYAEIDMVAEMEITAFDVSPEREHVREFTEHKEIEDGWEYFYDDNGNVAKDTLGNDIKKPRMVTIHADILEISRTKNARVAGVIKFYDARTTELLNSRAIDVSSSYKDYACTFRGDRRALTTVTRKRLDNIPAPFPTDQNMALRAADKLKGVVVSEIKRFII